MNAELLESQAGDFSDPVTARSVGQTSVPDPVAGDGLPTSAADPVGAAIFRRGVMRARTPHEVDSPDAGSFIDIMASAGFTQFGGKAPPKQPTAAQLKAAKKKAALSLNPQATAQLKAAIAGYAAAHPKPVTQKFLSPQVLQSVANAQATAAAHIFLRGLTKPQFRNMLSAAPALKKLPDSTLQAITGLSDAHAEGLNFTRTMNNISLSRYGLGYEAGALDFTAIPPVYVVESGDFPSKIAQKLTGDQSRWKELVAANPQKSKSSDGNFATLFANEKLNLPVSWLPLVAAQAPQGTGFPTIPGLPSIPSGLPSIPGLPSMPQSTPLPSGAGNGQFTYTVQAGDFASKIAQKLTGNPGLWPQLVAENCPPKNKQTTSIITMTGPEDEDGDPTPQTVPNPNAGNFTTLNSGEILKIPVSWNSQLATGTPGLHPPLDNQTPSPPPSQQAPPAVPPPQNPIPIPSPIPGAQSIPLPPPVPTVAIPVPVPGNPSTTMDPAVYASVQADLATWRKLVPGQCNPSDFGADAQEFTGTDTARTHTALSSFQQWYNVAHPLGQFAPGTTTVPASIRTDGTLDQMSYIALHGTVVKLLSTGGAGDTKKSSGGGGIAIGIALIGAMSQMK